MVWWQVILAGVSGGAVTGFFALWVGRTQASNAYRAAQLPERGAFIERKRQRLMTLFEPVVILAGAMQGALVRAEGYAEVIADADRRVGELVPIMTLEPGCDEFAERLRKLRTAYALYESRSESGWGDAGEEMKEVKAINDQLIALVEAMRASIRAFEERAGDIVGQPMSSLMESLRESAPPGK